MGLTTERKVFLGVMAVSGAALIIDQGFLKPSETAASGPASATASPQNAAGAPRLTPASADASSAAGILIKRLSDLRGERASVNPGDLDSAFELAGFVRSEETRSPASSEEASGITDTLVPIPPPAPVNLPSLSAVMPAEGGSGGALLGGRLMRVGDTGPSGFTLLEVRARGVVVGKAGRSFTIELPGPARE